MADSGGQAQPPLSLRSTCLRRLATGLGLAPGRPGAEAAPWLAGVVALPLELRLELMQLLARWQLLDETACAALSCPASCLPSRPSASPAAASSRPPPYRSTSSPLPCPSWAPSAYEECWPSLMPCWPTF